MFRRIPAIRFSSVRVLVFIRFMRLCKDGEILSSVVLIITTIKRRGWVGGFCNVSIVLTWGAMLASIAPQVSTILTLQNPPTQPRLLIVVIIKTTDDKISPSLHNRINLINTNTLTDENLMAGIRRNMQLLSSSNKHH